MTERTMEEQAALKTAADYVKVYTRPVHPPQEKLAALDTGCFKCRHVKPNMSPGWYTTIFGMLVLEQEDRPPKLEQAFGITVCFDDKAWYQDKGLFMSLDRGAYRRFPELSNAYRTVRNLLETDRAYVRLLSAQGSATQHVNTRVSGKDLLKGFDYKPEGDVVLLAQPAWQRNMYIDPSAPIGTRELGTEDLRFLDEVSQRSFADRWINQSALQLTQIKGTKKKTRKSRYA